MDAERHLDKIHVRDLLAKCIVGVHPEEALVAREIRIDIALHADLRAAGKSDSINDTVDYEKVAQRALAAVEGASYGLVERLAEHIAETCLEDVRVRRVTVTVDKPGALRSARSVAVEITRDSPLPVAGQE